MDKYNIFTNFRLKIKGNIRLKINDLVYEIQDKTLKFEQLCISNNVRRMFV